MGVMIPNDRQNRIQYAIHDALVGEIRQDGLVGHVHSLPVE